MALLAVGLAAGPGFVARAEPPPSPPQAPSPPSPSPPQAAATMDLVCWQNGVRIIDEAGVSRFPHLKSGIAVRKGDGSGLHLFSDEGIQALCLLRLPKDLPPGAFAY